MTLSKYDDKRGENIWWRSLVRCLLVRCKSSEEANRVMAPYLISSQKRYKVDGKTGVIHKLVKADAMNVIRGLAGEYAEAAIAVLGKRGNGRASQYKALAMILSSYLADERPQGFREEEVACFIRHHRAANRMVERPSFREILGNRPWPPTVKDLTAEATVDSVALISPTTSVESSPSSSRSYPSSAGTSEYSSERELDDTASKPCGLDRSCQEASSLICDFGSSVVLDEMQRLCRMDSFHELDTSVIESLSDYADIEKYF